MHARYSKYPSRHTTRVDAQMRIADSMHFKLSLARAAIEHQGAFHTHATPSPHCVCARAHVHSQIHTCALSSGVSLPLQKLQRAKAAPLGVQRTALRHRVVGSHVS